MYKLNEFQSMTMMDCPHMELIALVINTNAFLIWDNGINRHFILTEYGYIQDVDYYYDNTFPFENNLGEYH